MSETIHHPRLYWTKIGRKAAETNIPVKQVLTGKLFEDTLIREGYADAINAMIRDSYKAR